MKISEALTLFLQVDRAEQTQTTYTRFLNKFVAAIGPERPLDLIRPEDLDAYVFEMRHQRTKYANHPRRPPEDEPLSSVTVYKNVKMIKTFFKWCVERGYLQESPARFLVNTRPVRPLGQGKAATDEELALLLEASRFKPRDRAIVLLIAQSGCRAGEAARLRIRDLELGNCSAVVSGKGDKRRRIFFDDEAADALRAWLAVRPETDHDYVFTSSHGDGPLATRSLSDVFRRLAKKSGVDRPLGAHSLRHRVGLTFARAHVAPRVTQHYLGHSDVIVTLSYYQDVDEGDLREAGHLLKTKKSGIQKEGKPKEKPAGKIIPFPQAG